MNRVLVIGATGNIGRRVVYRLQAMGAPVRALTRNRGAIHLPAEVHAAYGDLTIPESMEEALDEIDAVFLVWTAPVDTAERVIDLIQRRARRIVLLSSPHNVEHPFFQKPQPNAVSALHKQLENLIDASGLEWTFLRPGMLASNALFWWAPQIRGGDIVQWVYLDAPTAPTDERDIAAVAVRALCDDEHAGKEYVLTGPESLSQREQISAIGRVIGRQLRIEEIAPEEGRKTVFSAYPPPVADMLFAAWSAALRQPTLVTQTIEQVTGTPARRFEDWARDHTAEFRA